MTVELPEEDNTANACDAAGGHRFRRGHQALRARGRYPEHAARRAGSGQKSAQEMPARAGRGGRAPVKNDEVATSFICSAFQHTRARPGGKGRYRSTAVAGHEAKATVQVL